MAVTKNEILTALGVNEAQFDTFMTRGMLLTARDAIDSQVSNKRKAQADYVAQVEAEIAALNEQRAAVQAQIDAL